MDQVDHEDKIIYDNKVLTEGGISKLKQYDINDNYNLQLGVYKYLLYKKIGEIYDTVLVCVNKSYSYFRKNKKKPIEFIAVSTHDPDEMEKLLLEKTNELDDYIENGIEPAQCQNLFWYRDNGVNKPMKCIYYCDYNHVCPYYAGSNMALKGVLDL